MLARCRTYSVVLGAYYNQTVTKISPKTYSHLCGCLLTTNWSHIADKASGLRVGNSHPRLSSSSSSSSWKFIRRGTDSGCPRAMMLLGRVGLCVCVCGGGGGGGGGVFACACIMTVTGIQEILKLLNNFHPRQLVIWSPLVSQLYVFGDSSHNRLIELYISNDVKHLDNYRYCCVCIIIYIVEMLYLCVQLFSAGDATMVWNQ